MKLTNEDIQLLQSWGHPQSDMKSIQYACNHVKMTLSNGYDHNPINSKDAIKVLGRETFLSGVARAAFHATASRCSDEHPGLAISFSLLHIWPTF